MPVKSLKATEVGLASNPKLASCKSNQKSFLFVQSNCIPAFYLYFSGSLHQL